MAVEPLAIAVLAILPATIAAIASWKNTGALQQRLDLVQGTIEDQLDRVEDKLDKHIFWHLGDGRDKH